MRAATCYHLGFESLHPLRDGNGRVGRWLLATQCETAVEMSRDDFLAELQAGENDYKMVFVPSEQAARFELLLDLVARITGVVLLDGASRLPMPLAPLQDAIKTASAGQVPAAGFKSNPRQPAGFWRKFG